MNTIVRVGMADLNVSRHPCMITTLGLGSCIGITLYDVRTKISGMAHIMLPSSTISKDSKNEAKFADTAMDKLLRDMIRLGASLDRLVAKMAGGAQMFAFTQTSEVMKIGYRNTIATKELLSQYRIPLIAEDTGGNIGRTIELYSEDGRLVIKTVGAGVSVL